jgi:glycosyltransferase involved in cell wall biosynthesis
MILTIAIPTYNRPEKVKNTIVRLLPQLSEKVKILILDNCSNVVVKDYLEKEIELNISEQVKIIRHRINIGADANFQRCFELCDTPYIWMLGDDDKIEEDALDIIFREIKKYEHLDLVSINFASNCCLVERETPTLINSTSELVEKLDFFGNMLFISTSVYRTEEYIKYLSSSIWAAYSMASQVVPTLMAVNNKKVLVLSEKHLVDHVHVNDPKEKWSDIQITLCLSTLLDANIGLKENEYLKLGQHFNTRLFSAISTVFFTIVKSVQFDLTLIDGYHRYIFRQIYYRTYIFRPNKIKDFLYFHTGDFLLKNIFLLKLLMKIFPDVVTKMTDPLIPYKLFVR